jgi:hypothetical protein
MKDNRFIELLNLYIDRQITAEETAELESEIQSSPKRQAVYRQYCQIHTATKQVYASFRASSTEQPSVESGRSGVIELFESRRRRANSSYYAAGLAAAACLALVFMRYNQSTHDSAPILASKPQPVVQIAAKTAPEPVAVSVESAPGLVSLRNTIAAPAPDYAAMLTLLREQDEERAFSSERVYVNATPSLFGDEVFQSKRVLGPQEQRVFRSRQTPAAGQSQAEFSAFQFQR